MRSGGCPAAGSSRMLRLDPFALPIRFEAADDAADERVRIVDIHRERVVLRRSVRGMRMALNMPVKAFRGVAIRLVAETVENPGAITAAELAEVLLGTRSELDRPSHLRIGLQIVRVLPRHLFERNALAHIGANAFLGDVRVLEVLDMLEDGLAGVETLGPASLLGESVGASFNFGRQAKGKHSINV